MMVYSMCPRGWREALWLWTSSSQIPAVCSPKGCWMKLAAVEVGLEAWVALSSQPSLLLRCRVYPMILLLPIGLKCRIKGWRD